MGDGVGMMRALSFLLFVFKKNKNFRERQNKIPKSGPIWSTLRHLGLNR